MQVFVTFTILSLLCFSGEVNRLGTTTFDCEQEQGMDMYDSDINEDYASINHVWVHPVLVYEPA